METKIKAKDLLFRNFHSEASEVFYIPSLQRPYTWEAKKHVERLFEDITESEKTYYIGSIVSIHDGGTASKDQIIDGQQRLTTLYLLLTACREFAKKVKTDESENLAEDINDYLIKYKKQGKEISGFVRLSFTNKSSDDVYRAIVQSENLSEYKSEIQKKFIDNYNYLYKRICDYCGKGKQKFSRLMEIVEKIENLQVIFIECHDKSTAYKLFETINATGVDLSTNDLIKNSIFEKLHNDSNALKEAESGWAAMFENFEENSSLLKTYIRHHWLSTVDYTSHSRLFDDFQKTYTSKDMVVKYSKSLYSSAQTYKALRYGNVEILSELSNFRRIDIQEVKDTLIFLSSLGVDQVYSVLLNLYNNDSGTFKKDLIRLSSFQFIFKFIPGSPSLPEKEFASFCKGKISKNKLFDNLKKLCVNKEEDFVENLTTKTKYLSNNTAVLQHILEKYLYYYGPEAKCPEPTIEHIIPQEKKDKIYTKFGANINSSKAIHSIGNLTILSRSENSDEKKFNQEFVLKYPLYAKNIFLMNKKISHYKFDNDPLKAINTRGKEISKDVYQIFIEALEKGKWPKEKTQ